MTIAEFIGKLKDEKCQVRVFLANGVKLEGIIIADDEEGLILEREGKQQAVFNCCIATVSKV